MPSLFHCSSLAAALLCLAIGGAAAQQAPNAISHPAHKKIGTGRAVMEPALFVLNSQGATLQGDKLVLTGIAPSAVMFADRPVRAAGHVLTKHFVEEWGEGSDSFAKDPPNATVSVFNKEADSVADAVVTLRSPKLEGTTLTFDVSVLEGDLKGGDGAAALFIDIIGRPFTPLSFAGGARRAAFRGAWYGAAAAGAVAAGAAAAAYAAPYPYPYYRPACGYYPYPPCY